MCVVAVLSQSLFFWGGGGGGGGVGGKLEHLGGGEGGKLPSLPPLDGTLQVLLISHAFENCVSHWACVSTRFVLKSMRVKGRTQCSNVSEISSRSSMPLIAALM